MAFPKRAPVRAEEHGTTEILARGMRGLLRIAGEMPAKGIREVAQARSDYEVLLRVLEWAPPPVAAAGDDLSEARLRGLRERDLLLGAEGGTVPVAEAAKLLRVTRQAVDKRRKAGRLLGLPVGRRGYAYPAWQFSREGVLPGLEEALQALKGHDPWMKAVFLLNRNTRLGGDSPLHALRKGRVEKVCRAARTFGEHGSA